VRFSAKVFLPAAAFRHQGFGGASRRRGGASKFAVRIFVKKSSDFNQKAPPDVQILSRDILYKNQPFAAGFLVRQKA